MGGSWPTSGTRGSNGGSAGFPSGGSSTGGGLYPLTDRAIGNTPSPAERAAANALRDAIGKTEAAAKGARAERERLSKPFGRRTEPYPTNAGQSALGGLGNKGRGFLGPIGIAFGLYEAYRFLPSRIDLGDYKIFRTCPGVPKQTMIATSGASCGSATFWQGMPAPAAQGESIVSFFTNPVPAPTSGFYQAFAAETYTRNAGTNAGRLPRAVPGAALNNPDPRADLRDNAGQNLDPLSRPPGGMQRDPWTPPWAALPHIGPNPYRAPTERTERGSESPLRPNAPLEVRDPYEGKEVPGSVGPKPGTQPKPKPQPKPAEAPADWPHGDLPGWVAQEAPQSETQPESRPETSTETESQAKPQPQPEVTIKTEHPPGAVGPTITIGPAKGPDGRNLPPIGPHEKTKPDSRTKERKRRYLKPGAALLIRKGVNPVTEALEAMDCAWKALPKRARWEAMKNDWKRQRAEGKVPRPRSSFQNEGVKASLGDVPGLADALERSEGSTGAAVAAANVTLPRGANVSETYADLGANYIQPPSPQLKMATIWQHANDIDVDKMLACMAADAAEDMLIGRTAQAVNTGWNRASGSSHGVFTGPTF